MKTMGSIMAEAIKSGTPVDGDVMFAAMERQVGGRVGISNFSVTHCGPSYPFVESIDYIEHPTLYKRTSTGAIQTWCILQDGDRYKTSTGQIDGKTTESKWKRVAGKNLGKANATTGTTQADAEIAAKYRKKKSQGQYHDTVDTIDIAAYHKPMKAKKYKDRWKGSVMFDADEMYYSQRKLNGIRCIIDKFGMWTFTGQPITAMPHIWEAVNSVFSEFPDIILDGELYNHDYFDRLNRISGLCRKQNLTPSELEETSVIEFHMYDATGNASGDGWELTPDTVWEDRLPIPQIIHDYLGLSGEVTALVVVETTKIENQDHCDELYAAYMQTNYEGQMIRWASGQYEGKYSAKMLKRKKYMDEEFTIIGFTEGVGNRAGMAGNIRYKTEDGKEFASGIAGGVEFYKHLWENQEKYIGGEGTVWFFEWSEYGIPQQGVTYVVYDGKRDV